MKSLICVRLFVTPWSVSCRAPPSMDFPGKNTGVGCHSLLQGTAWPRDRTQVSCTAGRLFTGWATREARSRIYIHKIFSVVPKSIMYIVSSRIIYWVLFLGLALSRMRLENFKILLVHNFWIQVPCSWVCEAAHRWMALAQLGKCCDKFIYKCHSNSHTHTHRVSVSFSGKSRKKCHVRTDPII